MRYSDPPSPSFFPCFFALAKALTCRSVSLLRERNYSIPTLRCFGACGPIPTKDTYTNCGLQ